MIDVLVPVLGRARNVGPFVESFHSAECPGEIHFLCSPGDEEEIAACEASGKHVIVVDWEPGPGDYAKKMNLGYRSTVRPWLFLAADDIRFGEGWWTEALRVAEVEEASVVATNDMANRQVMSGQFGTHCLVRRAYVDEEGGSLDGPGHLVHEGYDHNFVDRELCHLAESRGKYAFAEKAEVLHLHPNWRSARMDATYRKGTRGFREDQKIFFLRGHRWGYVGMAAPEKARSERLRLQS